MAKTYELEFKGYWVEEDWESLPEIAGVYCVYAATHLKNGSEIEDLRLLYIGEAENVRDRIPEDPEDRWDEWINELSFGEVLCFSCAEIKPKPDRKRAEAAMIYRHKPPCNTKYKYKFPCPETTVLTSGDNAKLDKEFTV